MASLGSNLKAAAGVLFGTGVWGSREGSGAPMAGGDAFSMSFDAGVARSIIDSMDAGDLYATQPYLRTVISFVARNGAQLGRHIYKKTADGGRERVSNSPAEQLLHHPNDYMTGYDLFNMLFSELALYDIALWAPVFRDGRWQIDPIPGEWITGIRKKDAFMQAGYRIKYPHKTEAEFVPASAVIVFRGYSPHGFQKGSSAVRSLRATLGEQVAATSFREQMWKRGGRVGMFMTRPADAPQWSDDAKTKFIQQWRANWSGGGPSAGSTPLLEDGMELKRVGFNAKEEQWLEAATLSLSTVAGAYHVPPAMVGVPGYNSFASVKEFRKMLYTETLGPLISQVEDTINIFLLPFIAAPKGQYLELNIQEKLQGDFEEQAAVMQQAVGGPWMTVNEARIRANLPQIEGGDELLAPLNMGAAGNNGPVADAPIDQDATGASESDAADGKARKSNDERHPTHTDGLATPDSKAPVPPSPEITKAMAEDLRRIFKAQRTAAVAALSDSKKEAPEWWDQKKWNQELSATLLPHMTSLSAGVARTAAGAKGLDPESYSVGQTANFLKAVADSRADLINSTTRDAIADTLKDASEESVVERVTQVFDVAIEARAPEASVTMSTMIAGWAMTEMARQLLADKGPKKTWVSSGLANSRHAGMNGQTVGINEKFSNGADWPGDPSLGAGQVANCLCGVDITY